MGRRTIDLTGKTFGRLTVIDRYGGSFVRPKWNCRCQCGTLKIVSGSSLTMGNTKSCGCLVTKHGKCGHPLYPVWASMKGRCHCPTHADAARYHDRGITVYTPWRDSFRAFFTWAIENGWKKGLEIDRTDNDGDYTPKNCRFVDHSVNNSNRGRFGKNTSGYTGITQHGPGKWLSRIKIKGAVTHLGTFHTIEEAVAVRNMFISKNQLPHPIQGVKKTVPHAAP